LSDVRAVWVNPAGLGAVPEASIMAEAVVDRPDGSVKLGQYTLGLNSRGLGISYQRDRSRDSVSVGIVRLGLGLPIGRGSMGAAMSSYGRGGSRQQGYDLGVRYPVIRALEAGVVVRNLSRPQPVFSEAPLPIVTVASATWSVAPELANLSVEATAVERPGAVSGFDLSYRGGFVVRAARPWPLALHATASVDGDGSLRQWSLGLMVGRLDRVGVVASAAPTTGLGEPRRFSAVGVASRRGPTAAP
jgi:hypothetical protein